MTIKLTTKEETLEITQDNFTQSIQMLDNMLQPGTPVLFHNYTTSDIALSTPRHAQKIVIFSDGHISKDGALTQEKGKRNFSYATMNENDPFLYQIVHSNQNILNHDKITFPKNWSLPQHNEGTFSQAGPSTWQSSHSAGTIEIMVGDIVQEQFSDVLNAIQFARDAIYFKLDQAYSMQSYLIREIGDNPTQEKEREHKTSTIASLRAAMNLINQARREMYDTSDSVSACHVGWFKEGVKKFQQQGHPITSTDYIIEEFTHPFRKLGFIKVGKGAFIGETYILPYSQKMDSLIEHAFSKETIRKYYPYELGE